MSKAVIQVGYMEYVMDSKDAVAIYDILAKAERYKRVYRNKEEGGPLFYIWDQDGEDEMRQFSIMSDSLYRMAKLAGKPPEDR